eukprot:3052842-Pyramimonas_sp.AAC.2
MEAGWKPHRRRIEKPSQWNAAGNAPGVLDGHPVGILVGARSEAIGNVFLGIPSGSSWRIRKISHWNPIGVFPFRSMRAYYWDPIRTQL